MPVLERDIERRFVAGLKKRGLPNLKLNVMFSRGWPDRLIFIPGGRPLLVELKRPGEDLSPLQKDCYEMLRKLEYDVEVHWSSETALASVDKHILVAAGLPTSSGEMVDKPRARRRPLP